MAFLRGVVLLLGSLGVIPLSGAAPASSVGVVCHCPLIPAGVETAPGAPPCRCPVSAAIFDSATPAVMVRLHAATPAGSSFTTTTGLTVYVELHGYFAWRGWTELEVISRPS